MARILKWLTVLTLLALLVLAAGALGLPVRLDGIEVALWPLPAVALNGVSVQSKPALTLALLRGAA